MTSSSRRVRVAAGWVRWRLSAARTTLPWSYTAMSRVRCRNFSRPSRRSTVGAPSGEAVGTPHPEWQRPVTGGQSSARFPPRTASRSRAAEATCPAAATTASTSGSVRFSLSQARPAVDGGRSVTST